MFNQLGLIGCGLMGGSFALALKKAGLVKRVVGYSKSPSTVEKARRMGVIDVSAESALLAVSGSDIVLVAVPVAATEATFKAIRHLVDPNMLVMDVGSTKRDVVDAARRVLKERLPAFVPAHPIAGKESAGIEHADATLYQGRKTILTPLAQTDARLVQKATDVWAAVGCQVLKMTPEHHDEAFAAVSHLPHLLAFAYLNSLTDQNRGGEYLSLAGPGFRDFSRIAASDPTVWRDILLSNREEVLRQSEAFRQSLEAMERQMRDWDGPALQQLIQQASDARSAWQLGAPLIPAGPKPGR
jgi:prephenate dehydrogenase